ncbi:Crp/Fnr family transcriptional regulator [Flavicella sp.]|uniref:Crp/Fnr family transcriptional regulator n=1 Tax=Flavicella sp. TaxID=2957742 RepID=UPI00262A951E|nr:Crp/Fnr family transcriptional regulator [Flavicella sp.]MDG1805807.1 Crp/Fnr family transcriptional regulator [Flavicella sp.]
MLQDLISSIKNLIEMSPEAEEYVNSIAKEKKVSKGDILIRQGQRVENTFYVTSGCIRSFCVDKNGKEHTLQFAIKNWWISDFIAYYDTDIATLTVECIKDSNIIQFNAKDLDEIYLKFSEFEIFQRKILERHVVSLNKRILNQLQLTAKERYNLFTKQYPDIELYTPNYHIASYLGITQQSLSRIRAEKSKT